MDLNITKSQGMVFLQSIMRHYVLFAERATATDIGIFRTTPLTAAFQIHT